jgi:CRP-like cAMP-binding protein
MAFGGVSVPPEGEMSAAVTFNIPDAAVAKVDAYPDGGVIFIRGDSGSNAYLVRRGLVEIREAGRALETVRPGELFGEMALIDEGPRSASAVAVGPTEVAIIDRDAFHRLVRSDPDFALGVMHEMARRLRAMNAQQRPSEELPIVQRPRRSA